MATKCAERGLCVSGQVETEQARFRVARHPAAIRRLRASAGNALLITVEGPNAGRRESIYSEDCRTGVSRVEQQVPGRLRD